MAVSYGKLICVLDTCVAEKKVLQERIEELGVEAGDASQLVAEMEVNREEMDRRIKKLEADKRTMIEEITTLVKAALKDQKHRIELQVKIAGLRERIEEFQRRCSP